MSPPKNSRSDTKGSEIPHSQNGHANKIPAPVMSPEAFQGLTIATPDEFDPIIGFNNSILRQDKTYPDPVQLVTIRQDDTEHPVLTEKSMSLWQGKQKSKKTTTLLLFVAAFLTGSLSIISGHAMHSAVLWFDTEQGESYAARTMKLILKISGFTTNTRLVFCDLRSFTPGERIEVIKAALKTTPNVKLVIIDGLVDLMNDFMDSKEAHKVVTTILKLCSEFSLHVACVLHQNKADKNARAHVGTICSQKCEVEISAEVDSEDRAMSIISCVNSRAMPFEPFAIRWDKGSLPEICSDWKTPEAITQENRYKRKLESTNELVKSIFKPLASISYTDAIDAIMKSTRQSESTAKRNLKEFLTWDMITKGDDNLYRLKI